ncbi:hypothetical protein [Alteribacter populi]|uniref:hypothetical protein n=1 Tax=Alteribacter populi TaxID=2011011 RepID=UPI000BBA595A|nr:hypothetical protein [Alteribacter populi]
MAVYHVDQAFELLKKYKITTHKESVRRWFRQGVIEAKSPTPRKDGWLLPKISLHALFKSVYLTLMKRML